MAKSSHDRLVRGQFWTLKRYHPVCPSCGKKIGEIRIVRGHPALKINHGTVKKTRT